jgi:thioredoxin reductase (NADPH)
MGTTHMGYELIVIGGGPAGLSAGIYGARSGLKTLILEKAIAGGRAGEAPLIENYPGLEAVSGMDLAEKLKVHAARYVEIKELEAVRDIEVGQNFLVKTEKGEYLGEALIIATGATHRKLGVKGEAELAGKGVSYCATCDGFLFKGRRVAVVGGGNAAAMYAIYLDNLGCDVILIHRRGELRADDYLKKKLEGRIDILLNSVVVEITGRDFVEGIRVHDMVQDMEKELEVDGVFVAIGEVPNSELAAKIGVSLDQDGYIKTDKTQRTNISRVYAAGDVTGGVRQIVVACSEGAVAALSAFEDIKAPRWAKKSP